MADVDPRKRIAQLLRKLGPGSTANERRSAFRFLEQEMQSDGTSWSDIGNAYESSADGKFTKEEMQDVFAAARKEGVEAGIKIGLARAQQQQSNGNGNLLLPSPSEMAEHCHQQLSQLKDDKQREFISNVYFITRRGINLSLGRLGYLASVYIQIGGMTK